MPAASLFVTIAGVLGAVGVSMGAFGAHVFEPKLSPRMFSIFETAVRYHLIHAVCLLGTGLLLMHHQSTAFRLAGWLFVAGIVVFSGTLYVLSLSGMRWLGAITPLGGLALVAGWLLLAYGAWRMQS